MSIPGASLYRNAAVLSNTRGLSPSTTSLLSGASAAALLNQSRNLFSIKGIGASASSRALTESFLNRTNDINQMFSLGLGADATTEGMRQQILALRATLPVSSLHSSVTKIEEDNGAAAASSRGSSVNRSA